MLKIICRYLAKSKNFIYLLALFYFPSVVRIFFINQHYVWSFGRDYGISVYLKIPENFVRLIF